MNRIERFFGSKKEARLRFKAGEFQVEQNGDYVNCAVTGQRIELADLRYWSVELQEPYASAEFSLQRYLEMKGRPKSR